MAGNPVGTLEIRSREDGMDQPLSAAHALDVGRLQAELLEWFDRHGRHDLPWQHPRTAYRVWVSEIMLQQTQVATVVPYFGRFMERFPDIPTLAAAPMDAVLASWAGLGYYARARNLHRAAQIMLAEHGGEFPEDFDAALALPGIGRSTAGAILAQAFGARYPILDGNVKRVLSRLLGLREWPGKPAVEATLWEVAERLTPETRLPDWTQAMMDLGATLCRRSKPACLLCPVQAECRAHAQGAVDEIPLRKPKAERPQRHVTMLMVTTASGEVWLERRPESGIWGGLWSLPEAADEASALGALTAIGLPAAEAIAVALAPVRHGFTHFELHIQPLHVMLGGAPSPHAVAECTPRQWCRIDDVVSGAVGAPALVVRLLSRLQTSEKGR